MVVLMFEAAGKRVVQGGVVRVCVSLPRGVDGGVNSASSLSFTIRRR